MGGFGVWACGADDRVVVFGFGRLADCAEAVETVAPRSNVRAGAINQFGARIKFLESKRKRTTGE